MTMSRQQLRHRALCDAYHSGRSKPPTRAQAKAWLSPIRKAFREIKTGEVDAHRGYAITRIHWADDDFARVDHCINGFVALLDRLMPDFDSSPLKSVSKKLETGILMSEKEIDSCFTVLNQCEDMLIKFKRSDLTDAAITEQVNIELERLGLKEAA